MGRIEPLDNALMDACRRGDDRAWEQLVRRYGRLVYSIPHRYKLPAADADEIFQNVFAGLHNALSDGRQIERLSAWLITAAHRQSWRVMNRRRRETDLILSHLDHPDEPPEAAIVAWERQHAVHRALERIGEPCAGLLRMLFFERDTPAYAEIAARLGIAVGSIGPMRGRCFTKLEALLRRTRLFDD